MVLQTKRVDSKHVIVLDAIIKNEGKVDQVMINAEIYLAKRLANGDLERIPDDEPVITFRGRDRLAVPLLKSYRSMCVDDQCNSHQLEAVDGMLRRFIEFSEMNPARMKQPGITRAEPTTRAR